MRTLGLAVSVACLTAHLAGQSRSETGGWQQAVGAYSFAFPRDHASHPDSKLEWWYYTGNLLSSDGRAFGYQLTFFRIGIDRRPVNPSRWAVRDLFMAHFAVTDIRQHRFQFAERINRAGIGWAGADVDRYRVWNEGWEARLGPTGRHQLSAREAEMAIDLELQPSKPPMDQGINGLSQKGNAEGNASRYYSLTRMSTAGTLWINGKATAVRGVSWMDHEFGTSFLEPGQRGWNWFGLQLDDNTELMLYEFRRNHGERDLHSSGSFIDSNGYRTLLRVGDFAVSGGAEWTSPRSGARYPIEWTIRIPSQQLDLHVRTAVPQQELVTSRSGGVTYWEGAVIVDGTRRGQSVKGGGYLEMTGYAAAEMSTVLR